MFKWKSQRDKEREMWREVFAQQTALMEKVLEAVNAMRSFYEVDGPTEARVMTDEREAQIEKERWANGL